MGPGMRMGMHQQMQGMPDGFRFVEVGEFRLKGIAEPVRIHEVMRAEG
jgi:class 3 adenylate cyclase